MIKHKPKYNIELYEKLEIDEDFFGSGNYVHYFRLFSDGVLIGGSYESLVDVYDAIIAIEDINVMINLDIKS
jgi:hypothetical protein